MSASEREERLVEAARAALTYFHRRLGGSQVNGPNDDVYIGRQLRRALEDFSDVPDPRDYAKRELLAEDAVTRYIRAAKREVR